MSQKNGHRIDIRDAVERSTVTILHGRPCPVQWRYQGAADAWAQALGGTDTWRQWAAPGTTYCDIRREIMWQFARNSPLTGPEDSGDSLASLQDVQNLFAVATSANLMYHLHRGTVIQATPALEMLLTNSDVDLSLPMSTVAPPYAAQYLHFGEEATRYLKAPNANLPGHMFAGVFCFFTPLVRGAPPDRWVLELIFFSKRQDRYNGQVTLVGETDRGDTSVGEWLDGVLGLPAGQSFDACRASMHAAMSYVVKLFLYMGLKQARYVEYNDYDDALQRAKGLGDRKRAKLLKRTMSLYNSIVVGPDTLPPQATSRTEGSGVAPHWRRGHFRMQPCGIGRQERKLIFLAPMLIHADQLQGEPPAPKAYCAAA